MTMCGVLSTVTTNNGEEDKALDEMGAQSCINENGNNSFCYAVSIPQLCHFDTYPIDVEYT